MGLNEFLVNILFRSIPHLPPIGGQEDVGNNKWICPKCGSINPLMSYKCHSCKWEVA